MSYLVLARKYRPQSFKQVVGQEHITDILAKSIESGRIAHAFLFCGPRGIGKTSCARILAKCLNCQTNGPTLEPCGSCFACQEIANSSSFDVIEIDGASNRGIDEIRTLRENVKFAPSYGRFKIYIVDEVHMLTGEAFNALLKTLEEPPPHVKFIFATTEANKVPVTIVSRCQRFDFKRISIDQTVNNLKNICDQENLRIDPEALYAIAKAAQGGMRDALSILDQLSALSDRTIEARDVFSMLGLVETQYLFDLADRLAAKDCAGALEVLESVVDKGKDIKQLNKDLIEHFRHLMVLSIGGKALSKLVDYPAALKEMLWNQSRNFQLNEMLRAIECLIEAQDIARITESLRIPLEIAFAKITYTNGNARSNPAPAQPAPQAAPRPAVPASKPAEPVRPVQASNVQQKLKETRGEAVVTHPELPAPAEVQPALQLEDFRREWHAITHEVSRKKMSVATYLQEGSPLAFHNSKLTVGFTKDHTFQKECLEAKDNVKMFQDVLSEKFKVLLAVEFKIVESIRRVGDAPVVDETLEKFQGTVVNEWHNE